MLDGAAKRLKMQNTMKALAASRLKYQIEEMEHSQGSSILQHPHYILDVDCFLFQLPLVKRILMSRSSSIILSLEGLEKIFTM